MKSSDIQRKGKWLFFMLLLFLLVSCLKDNSSDYYLLNKDVLENMQQNYLWYNYLPNIDPKKFNDPQKFLDSIIYKKYDRWSFIEKESDYLQYFDEATYYGYGFSFGSDGLGNLRIAFVFKNSDLYASGVQRGWIIKQINGVSVNDSTNINNLLGANAAGISNTFVFEKPDGQDVEMTFVKKEIVMNEVLYYDTLQLTNKVVGYIVFNGFIADAITELDSAFTLFKNSSVNDLILDLRYNGGGELDIAQYLASLIGGSTTDKKLFVNLTYNDKNSNMNSPYYFKAQPLSLNIPRLFVITTGQTASASEAVINGLTPFMPVYLIGSTTDGKPVGMNPQLILSYVLVAINFKLTNANNYGDYFSGIPVQKKAPDDLTHQFGDRNEACLHQALYFIENGSFDNLKACPTIKPYNYNWKGLQKLIGAY
jgi:C-terminal processing protease CtpA/Prc